MSTLVESNLSSDLINKEKQPSKISLRQNFLTVTRKEASFITMLGVFFFIAGITHEYAQVAMWVGFMFAAYSAIANDSIQTIGTFIASNRDKKWWIMWLYIGGIFLLTVTYSWYFYGGDVSHKRLASKGFSQAPTSFSFLQIAAPLFLLILTRLKMPVSTTFLLLSCFATNAKSLESVLTKSLLGYFVAFGAAIFFWLTIGSMVQKKFEGKPHPLWTVGQWITTGVLWSVWVMQDAANIAVYLPRSLSFAEFSVFAGVIFCGLGIMFATGGEKIQEVVDEKSDVVDVRSATIIDFIYAIILYIFKIQSNVPMSTTWVFIGLLAGREIGMKIMKSSTSDRTLGGTMKIVGRDIGNAGIGLLVSLALAVAINENIRLALFRMIGIIS